jgi:hypothetical protein
MYVCMQCGRDVTWMREACRQTPLHTHTTAILYSTRPFLLSPPPIPDA